MPFNGSGIYTPPAADFPVVSGTLIQSSKFNNTINDIASALSLVIVADGQRAASANLPMGGFKHTNVADATARNHYAAVGQVQDQAFNWAGTAGGTADALTLGPTPAITAYIAGQAFVFKSGASPNTGAATVAVSGLVTKAIQIDGGALVAGNIAANKWYRITYDGAAFQLEGLISGVSGSFFNTKGDLLSASAADTPVIIPAGADGKILVPNSASSNGLVWVEAGIAMLNGQFNARVSANDLIFEVLTNSGGTPSESDPVFVAFRDPTLTNGGYLIRKVSAALVLTVPNTATLGTFSTFDHRLYCFLADEGGTVRIGAYNPADYSGSQGLKALLEAIPVTSTLISTGADSTQVTYTNDAVTSAAIRVIGYCEITEATAGVWATAPTKVHTLKPGDARTGDIVQEMYDNPFTSQTGTTVLPLDNTIPQSTEGTEFMTLIITPTNGQNFIFGEVHFAGAHSVNASWVVALFRNAEANAFTAQEATGAVGVLSQVTIPFLLTQDGTSAITIHVRAGGPSAGTFTYDGQGGAGWLGGQFFSTFRLTEVFA